MTAQVIKPPAKEPAHELEMARNRFGLGVVAWIASFLLSADLFIHYAFACYLSAHAMLYLLFRAQWVKKEKNYLLAIIIDSLMGVSILMDAPAATSFVYPLFLWMTLGTGFRLGLKWLFVASIFSTATFGLPVMFTEYWQDKAALGYSLTLGLLIIPAYCSKLIRKLSDAKDEAEAASRAKSYFLASVSHELRTPLNAIIGYGNHLKQLEMPKNQHDMIDASVRAGEHLLHLIDQLIQVARNDSGTTVATSKAMRATDLIAEIRDILLVKAQEKGLAIQLHADPLSDRMINGPSDVIRNILLNLAGNAIKFTESGSISISSTLEQSHEKSTLVFTVGDTGIGIAQSAQKRIFEPFQQADETVLNRFGGTGLGLAICRQLLDQIGGTITVESELGRGTIFTVALPVENPPIESLPVESDPASEPMVKLLALGRFSSELMGKAQAAGNYHVRNIVCTSVEALVEALKDVRLSDYRIAMVEASLAEQLGPDASVWAQFGEARVAPVLVANSHEFDLGDIELRAAFATIIPVSPNFDEVRSAIRIGCSFAGRSASDAAKRTDAPESYTPRTILVADDNRTNRNILAAILENADHSVTMVCDGDETLEALEKSHFDIVLLDVNMPRLNGIDACRMWRQIEGGRSHIPIVGVTADATLETEERCLGAGMDLRLTKPVNARLLLQTIEKCCENGKAYGMPAPMQDPFQTVVSLSGPVATNAETVIDPAHLDYLRSIGDDLFLIEMIDSFFSDAAESQQTLGKAVTQRDPAQFRFAAHALKSCSNNIGATVLAALCAKLEKITEGEFHECGERHAQAVRVQYDLAEQALRATGYDVAPSTQPAASYG
jgi:two-component system, sensor histidine kinase RpfC